MKLKVSLSSNVRSVTSKGVAVRTMGGGSSSGK